MLRAKINEENGGFIVKTRVKGHSYSEENTVFIDLDEALKFVKQYMIEPIDDNGKPLKRKTKAKVSKK